MATGATNYYNAAETPMGGSYMGAQGGGGGGDMNPDGAGADPFAYTQGSLLTPWQGRFNSKGYGGGYSAPAFTPFNYADFAFEAPKAGQFEEQYADPAAFRFADFAGPSDFQAPTAEAMRMDPGYQVRMDAVKKAQVAGAAHGGILRSGGFQKGLAKAVGDQASQEYGNVYNRRADEHDRLRREGEGNYKINQGNTFQAFDANTRNRIQGYQTRQGTWNDNANVKLREGELGYNVASGTWDRNSEKARTIWQDQQRQNEAAAAASNANANASYGRDLDDYMRARDEFWTNQDRQYGILDREAQRGERAANNYGNQMMGAYGAMGDYAMGGANARAAGTSGSGAAWGSALGDAGDTMSGMAMYGSMYGNKSRGNTGITGGAIPQQTRNPMAGYGGVTASPFGAAYGAGQPNQSRAGRQNYLA